jgi:hypothetical protein
MPQDVINCVTILARQQLSNRGLLFTNRLGEALPDAYEDNESSDSSYHPSIDESSGSSGEHSPADSDSSDQDDS